jgi:hypothetical protein
MQKGLVPLIESGKAHGYKQTLYRHLPHRILLSFGPIKEVNLPPRRGNKADLDARHVVDEAGGVNLALESQIKHTCFVCVCSLSCRSLGIPFAFNVAAVDSRWKEEAKCIN